MTHSPWSEEEQEKARRMWMDGVSASVISRALPGRSRNSVLGFVHRAPDLPLRDMTLKHQAARPRTKPATTRMEVQPQPTLEAAADLKPAFPPIYTFDLREDHCRWPFDGPGGETIYCGAQPRPDRPYCAGHQAMARRKVSDDKAEADAAPQERRQQRT